MIKKIRKLLNTNIGKILLSIILGLGLASLFKQKCDNNKCYAYSIPNLEEIEKNIFKYDKKCYKFDKEMIKCKNLETIKIA
jgi:hypothetical protein